MKLEKIVKYLDEFLNVSNVSDAALNTLQIEGCEELETIGLAVDFCMQTIQAAIDNKCQMLICHHGQFWPSLGALTGSTYKRVKMMMDNNISLYASHLPLDMHPEIGNNAVIMKMLDLKYKDTFAMYHGQKIGIIAESERLQELNAFQKNFDKIFDTESILIKSDNGKAQIKTVGIVSGGAAKEVEEASNLGLDLYITGEPSHAEFHMVKEGNTHMLCGGHYKTEATGIQALGKNLEQNFGLKTIFFDIPTGL